MIVDFGCTCRYFEGNLEVLAGGFMARILFVFGFLSRRGRKEDVVGSFPSFWFLLCLLFLCCMHFLDAFHDSEN